MVRKLRQHFNLLWKKKKLDFSISTPLFGYWHGKKSEKLGFIMGPKIDKYLKLHGTLLNAKKREESFPQKRKHDDDVEC